MHSLASKRVAQPVVEMPARKASVPFVPTTFNEAVESKEGLTWQDAMTSEYRGLTSKRLN